MGEIGEKLGRFPFPARHPISTYNFRPSAVAARLSVLSVADLFSGSNRRSNCLRWVFMRWAITVLVMPSVFMASAICLARRRLVARSSDSASVPCSARKSSKLFVLRRSFVVFRAVPHLFESHTHTVIPAKAGSQLATSDLVAKRDSRLRGNDGVRELLVQTNPEPL